MDPQTKHYNTRYLEKTASAGPEREKVAAGSEAFIEDHMREAAFVRSVLTPVSVTRDDPFIQVSTHHDTLVAIVEIQPESRGMIVDFRGRPDAKLVSAERVEVPFFTVSSDLHQAYEEELWAYTMKLTKKVEEQSALDVEELEDREWVIHSDAAVQAMQTEFNSGVATALHYTTLDAGTVTEYSARKSLLARDDDSNNANPWPLQKNDIIEGRKMLDGRRLRCDSCVIPEPQFDDISGWTMEEVGMEMVGETTINGFKGPKLVGIKYIRTIKTDILRQGNVYFYTSQEYLGRSYVLQKLKFWIDKDQNLLEWRCWEHIAQALINVGSVVKVETYSGDANPTTDVNSIVSDVTPVAEKAIGAANNRVADGTTFPSVEFY